jgi:hypothetical protein
MPLSVTECKSFFRIDANFEARVGTLPARQAGAACLSMTNIASPSCPSSLAKSLARGAGPHRLHPMASIGGPAHQQIRRPPRVAGLDFHLDPDAVDKLAAPIEHPSSRLRRRRMDDQAAFAVPRLDRPYHVAMAWSVIALSFHW